MFSPTIQPTEASLPIGRREATVAAAFERSGRGLHTGRRVAVRVNPAPAGHGIVFRRCLKGGRVVDIPGLWLYREVQPLCTALRRDDVLVRTVEHLMAALSALRVDNVLVETSAEELPAFDGSAMPWCAAITEAGRTELDTLCRVIRLKRSVMVSDGRRRLTIEPSTGLHISGHIALAHFGPLDWSGEITPETFAREIAPSRSFGRFVQALAGRAYGFAARKPFLQGCGPCSAALLVRGHAIGGLRVPDEPVRHRILDVIGDLALVGHPVEGRLTATHPGHELNHAFVAALMRDRAAWELA
ncbi:MULTISPECIES: UDP-3-O-acyl-N-acetylglucosamine deacetylase [unclassified Methylobacterium]|uniref:UDP-3-O-acyl-N-acetylglucosamine deacetylase n=1 Tax=unclassified Methylobacterium TaxID=2615210 RepID=UPI00226A79A0|nr:MULTISPECIES: UDP-3-O-acyl-N-acetylglucosamine deacetylase [unclassified Methylobacterium]